MIPYARETGVLVLALLWGGSLWLAYDYGGSEAKANAETLRADTERDARKSLEAEIAKRDKIAARLAEVLARPKVGPQVRTVIDENPSACRVPPAVHDSVQRGIDQANASR